MNLQFWKNKQSTNSIMKIHPYKHEGYWVFDDKDTGLVKEPFIEGMPEIINLIIDMSFRDISNADNGFTILFSDKPLPNTDLELKWIREEYGGNWYKMKLDIVLNKEHELEGWLCPALFKYFDKAPEMIYAKFEEKE